MKVQVELRMSPLRPLWTMCSSHSETRTFVISTERCVIEASCNTSNVQLGARLDRYTQVGICISFRAGNIQEFGRLEFQSELEIYPRVPS